MVDLDVLMGKKILEEKDSPINGHIRVVKDLAWGTYIQANGLTQSGGVVESIWKSTLKKFRNSKISKIRNVLILGLGGGTAAKIVRKIWSGAKITGVDIDPLMVEMGKKYLGLGENGVKIVIKDALNFVRGESKNKYDLIIVDLYQGDVFPKKFESEAFLRLILRLVTVNGVAIFNRLYFANKRPDSMKFLSKLEKVFPKVDIFHPEANIMFACRNTKVS